MSPDDSVRREAQLALQPRDDSWRHPQVDTGDRYQVNFRGRGRVVARAIDGLTGHQTGGEACFGAGFNSF